MIDQTIIVKPILEGFKKMKITAGEIEIELGLSPGYLSKVKNGVRSLEEPNLNKLVSIYKERVPQKKEKPTPVFIIESSVKVPINLVKKDLPIKVIEIKISSSKLQIPKGLDLAQQIQWRINNVQ